MTEQNRPLQGDDLNIVFLWATPRSVSTALERSLMQSPELKVVHEPFTDAYFFGPRRRSARYGRKDAGYGVGEPEQVIS